jgi:hypothetical protein
MPGDRSDKFTNFVSELGASVAYQKGLQGLSNLTNDAYQRDSKLAEWMNRHATLTYLGFAILAPIVASPIYGVVRPGLNWLFGRPVVRQGVDSVTQSKAADTILGPIERGASRLGHNLRQAYQRSPGLQGLAKFSIVGVGLAAVGAFVWTLVRLVQDTGRFGHHYGLARQTDRDSSPYALRQQVLQRLY